VDTQLESADVAAVDIFQDMFILGTNDTRECHAHADRYVRYVLP